MNQSSSGILTQLNRAMAYIEARIEDDLALKDIAAATAYSAYHFGRLFYYIADMPLSEYIRKRKLSLAAAALQSSDARVIDLALRYGYDSADSFTRAFVKQHGVTPSAARKTGISLTIFPPLTFQIKIKGVQAMNWRIEETEAYEVFGIEKLFRHGGDVPAFWTECHEKGLYHRLFTDAGGIGDPDRESPGVSLVNAICGYDGMDGEQFLYMICATVREDCRTEGYRVVRVPKSTWAVFRGEEADHPGPQIGGLFNRALSEWLPSSGYERASGPDLEVYNITENGKYCDEVWIPVMRSI